MKTLLHGELLWLNVLAVAFTLAVLVHSHLLPLMEGSDEILHTAYVEHLRVAHALPDRTTNRTNCTRQESGQPPLPYMLGALLLDALARPAVDCDTLRETYDAQMNPWLATPVAWHRYDNARVFVVTDHGDLPVDYMLNVRLMRLVSLAFGVLGIIGMYLLAREVLLHRWVALLAALAFACSPQIIHLSSYFNNDIPSVSFATLLFWRVAVLIKRGRITTPDLLWLGGLTGLGMLSKMSVTLLLSGIVLALLLVARHHARWRWHVVYAGLVCGGVAALIAGPWLLHGLLVYGDPIGTQTHHNPMYRYDPPRPFSVLLEEADKTYITYVSRMGVNKVLLDAWVYYLIAALGVVGLAGYGWAGLRGWRPAATTRSLLAVYGVMLLCFAVGYVQWFRTVYFVTGRLLIPLHGLVVLALIGGWWLWLRELRRPAWGMILLAGVFIAVGGVLTSLAVYEAYRIPPAATDQTLQDLQGPAYDFDETIRFLGYRLHQPLVTEHGLQTELCWEVLRIPQRRAAFSLKVVRDGEILADRTSLFGLGNYDSRLWQVGYRFCDRVYVPVNDPDTPAELEAPFRYDTQYDLLLVVLDAETFAVDWAATDATGQPVLFPFIGQVRTVQQP